MTDWRERSQARSSERARRRNRTIVLLVALATLIAATAAFAVPMLLTP